MKKKISIILIIFSLFITPLFADNTDFLQKELKLLMQKVEDSSLDFYLREESWNKSLDLIYKLYLKPEFLGKDFDLSSWISVTKIKDSKIFIINAESPLEGTLRQNTCYIQLENNGKIYLQEILSDSTENIADGRIWEFNKKKYITLIGEGKASNILRDITILVYVFSNNETNLDKVLNVFNKIQGKIAFYTTWIYENSLSMPFEWDPAKENTYLKIEFVNNTENILIMPINKTLYRKDASYLTTP